MYASVVPQTGVLSLTAWHSPQRLEKDVQECKTCKHTAAELGGHSQLEPFLKASGDH